MPPSGACVLVAFTRSFNNVAHSYGATSFNVRTTSSNVYGTTFGTPLSPP